MVDIKWAMDRPDVEFVPMAARTKRLVESTNKFRQESFLAFFAKIEDRSGSFWHLGLHSRNKIKRA